MAEKEELGAGGHKSIGLARIDKNGKWAYIGLIPLYDPHREITLKLSLVIRSLLLKKLPRN